MNSSRKLTPFILILLVAIGMVLWWFYSSPKVLPTPSITITSPAGGEAWQPGETHSITWTTIGIPEDNKISVTIRRIPPPPLQEEGQEFDPIIFTDLLNTGNAEWTIAPMYPSGTYTLGLTAYESAPITNPITEESQPFAITHPNLAPDLYPLYPGANWNRSQVESFLIGTTTYSGARMESAPLDADMDPGNIITPFENYYAKLLMGRGWSVANDLAAGGHVGGQTGYRKGSDVILTRFSINYQNKPEDAPSECPCDVTLSVFSTLP